MTIGFTGYFQTNEMLPEQKLFAAIIDQAILDAIEPEYVPFNSVVVKWDEKRKRNIKVKKKVYNEKLNKFVLRNKTQKIMITNTDRYRARQWFISPDSNFKFICDNLNFDRFYVRRIVKNIFEFCDMHGRHKLHDTIRDTRLNSGSQKGEQVPDKIKDE